MNQENNLTSNIQEEVTNSPITSLPIDLYLARDEDKSLIMSSWLKSYRKSDVVKGITNDVYFIEQQKIIDSLLDKCVVWVAAYRNMPSQIYGYSCCDNIDNELCAHFVYVKSNYRRLGICSYLLQSYGWSFGDKINITHKTYIYEMLEKRYNLNYNPYLLRRY